MIKEEFRSLNSSARNILGLELIIIISCISAFVYSAIGHPELEFLILPFSAVLFIPFFATFAYYRGFKRTSISALLSIFLAPAIGLIFILTKTPSQAAGMLVVAIFMYSTIASAVIPYIILATSLITHYYRKKRQ